MTPEVVSTVLALHPEPALVVGSDLHVRWANRAMATLLGLGEPEQLAGLAFANLLHNPGEVPELRAGSMAVSLVLRSAPGGGTPIEVEAAVGEVRWNGEPALLALLRPGRTGTVAGEKVGKDAPERLDGGSDVSQLLLRRQALLTQATWAFRIGVFEHLMVPGEGKGTHNWSDTMQEILGLPPGQPPTLDWFTERLHQDDKERVLADIARTHDPAGDGSLDHEFRWLHPDGSVLRLLVRGTTYFGDVEGRRAPVKTVGAMLDVTDRRSAEAEQQRLTGILEATPDLVAITDTLGRFIYLNRAGREFLGFARDEDLLKRNFAEVHPPSQTDLMLNTAIPTAIREGVWKSENLFLRHDGKVVTMSQVLLAPREADGKVAFLSTIARDLSRERELEEQFRQAQKMEATGRLAGGIAHDFNNALSAIMACTEFASAWLDKDHPAQRDLAEVLRASERAAEMTRQLLAFGRKQVLRPRVLDIDAVLGESEPLVRRLLGEECRLRVEADGRGGRIRADPTQIHQVLLNLVVNARDAMPEGGALTLKTHRVTLEDAEQATQLELSTGEYCCLSIADTGQGMAPDTQAQIFEPFFTTKEAGRGTGLGLSSVFGIMKQSGGAIQVESAPGRGSTFTLYFPCTQAPLSASASSAPAVAGVMGGLVLVVEDDDQLRDIVGRSLRKGGYDTVEVAGPEEALAWVAQSDRAVDLLLTDVMMPGMTGPDLVREVRQRTPDLPVLYMSGYTDSNVISPAALDAKTGFIAKPFTSGGLLIVVAEVLSR